MLSWTLCLHVPRWTSASQLQQQQRRLSTRRLIIAALKTQTGAGAGRALVDFIDSVTRTGSTSGPELDDPFVCAKVSFDPSAVIFLL